MSSINRSIRHRVLRRSATGALALGAIVWTSVAGAAIHSSEVADLVERVSPSVVTVLSTHTQDIAGASEPNFNLPNGSPFEEFFKRFGRPGRNPGSGDDGAPMRALGSGFVLDAAGYIITNNHVVEDASEVRVQLSDKREFDATVIGTDPQTDLALLKIDAGGALPQVTLADSDAIRVGDDVIAVGNPFGLGGTVTRGIVSAAGRDINAGPYVDFIQTDAAINRGNSGGPLFDMDGKVIGVNSAIYSPSGGSVGVGFAIPSNIVKTVVAQLKDGGIVNRGWLGVAIQTVTPEIASALGLNGTKGALVASVTEDGPAHDRLKTGDLILAFDGKPVRDSRDLPKLVGVTKAGSTVNIDILRRGTEKSVAVKIGELKTERHAANTNAPVDKNGADSERLNATVTALSPEVRQSLGLNDTVKGAVITALKADGGAAKAGLQVGDVIVQVGGTPVANADELIAALGQAQTPSALLLVNRHGDPFFIGVKLSA
jgi:serine protease Do